jgi:hypothetical protein
MADGRFTIIMSMSNDNANGRRKREEIYPMNPEGVLHLQRHGESFAISNRENIPVIMGGNI